VGWEKGKNISSPGNKCQKFDASFLAGLVYIEMKRLFGKHKKWIGLISILITLVIAWFWLPKLDLDVLSLALGRLEPGNVLLLLLFWFSGLLVRTKQLQLLLPKFVPYRSLILIILVRNFAVDILPMRSLSLFAHTVMLGRYQIESSVAGASFAVSSVLNAISMVVLLFPTLLVVHGPFPIIQFLGPLALLLIFGLVFLRWGGLVGQVLGKLPWPAWRLWGERWQNYFQKIGRFDRLILPFLWGFLGRLCKYLLLFTLFQVFCQLELTIRGMPAFFLALSAAELSAMLPVSGISGFGTWELAFVLMAGWLKLPTASPLEIGLLIHVTTQTWEALWAVSALILFRYTKGKR